ncbi:MAG: ETC complex I subunit [Beijerinckiaceae bacterium]
MSARIYSPSKTATQSGQAKTGRWLLEFVSDTPRQIDPLMGWTGGGETRQQIRLWFDSREAAEAYAQREGIAYSVEEPQVRKRRVASYSDNFRTTRMGQWTH